MTIAEFSMSLELTLRRAIMPLLFVLIAGPVHRVYTLGANQYYSAHLNAAATLILGDN
jgi:hypothetical protein